MSDTQVVINMKREIELLNFGGCKLCEKYVERFHQLVFKLALYIKLISTKNKIFKFVRTLLLRFALKAVAAEKSIDRIEKATAFVKAKIVKRETQVASKPPPLAATPALKIVSWQAELQYVRANRFNKGLCFIRQKYGRFSNKCWYRTGSANSTRSS